MVPWFAAWLLEVNLRPRAGFSEHLGRVPAQLATTYYSWPEDVHKG